MQAFAGGHALDWKAILLWSSSSYSSSFNRCAR